MEKLLLKEINEKLNDSEFMEDVKTVSIIINEEDRLKFAVYVDDLVCMCGYETEVNNAVDGCDVDEFEVFVKNMIDIASNKGILVFQFYDKELPEAWKESYKQGGITPDRWDRRIVFNAYNEPNEMFCIDQIDYMQLTGEIKDVPEWKKYMIDWYKNQLITNI